MRTLISLTPYSIAHKIRERQSQERDIIILNWRIAIVVLVIEKLDQLKHKYRNNVHIYINIETMCIFTYF